MHSLCGIRGGPLRAGCRECICSTGRIGGCDLPACAGLRLAWACGLRGCGQRCRLDHLDQRVTFNKAANARGAHGACLHKVSFKGAGIIRVCGYQKAA